MNKIYRIVWNEITATSVAVAEVAKGHSKRSGSVVRADHADRAALLTLPPLKALVASLALIGFILPLQSWAQVAANQFPTGGNVVAGSATITQGAAVMNINQTTNRAAVDWNTFNVGSAAQVNFNQPSSSSVTLNRVLDSNPSQIFGKITAPGQVFLSNPNGVVFAPGSRVDVGGLAATTHRIGVDDFMAGKTTFDRNGATGSVVNAGELKAALGGYIALLAHNVRNEGVIIAQAGTVALAAGEAITLNFADNGTLAGITATRSQIAALVENKNAVLAPGGLIILSAQAVSSLQGGVIKNSGRIEATGLSQRGGRIVLDASHTVENSGTISANASAGPNGGPAGAIEIIAAHASNTGAIEAKGTETQAGGSIHIRTGNFTQTAGATLDASAALRGGSVTLKASGQLQLGGRVDVSATADSASGGTVGGTGESAVASTGGQITAEAAQIDLNDATLDASGGHGGRITLDASGAQPVAPATPAPQPPLPVPERGKLILSGTTQLSTRGRRSSGGVGGDQTLLADHIHLNDTTALDATGATGGGTVRVGGGWQGSGGYYQATTLMMTEGATIDVSATKVGAGGTAVLWSDVTKSASLTAFAGTILAKGGAEGGAGGQVETSGHALGVSGSVSTGEGGQWLLDPADITISGSADSGAFLSSGTYKPMSGYWTSNIQAANIVSALNAGTSVTVTTTNDGVAGGSTGNITVNSAISTGAATGTRTLTLNAAGAIVVNAEISNSTGTFNVALNAGGSISGSGSIIGTGTTTFNVGSGSGTYSGAITKTTLVKSGAGTLVLTANNNYTGTTTINAGTLSISGNNIGTAPGSVTPGYLTLNGGNLAVTADLQINTNRGIALSAASSITVSSGVTLTYNGIIAGSGALNKYGDGTLTLGGANTYTGATNINAGTLSVSSLANGGTASGIGASSNAASNLVLDGGTLKYTGGGSNMDRLFTVGQSGGTIDSSGTSALVFNNTGSIAVNTGTAGRTLTLTGTNGFNNSLFSVMPNGGANNNLIKSGSGLWNLWGANTYEGTTTISAGTLGLGGSDKIANLSAINVSGGTFAMGSYSDTVGAVTLSGGSITGTGTLTGSSYVVQDGQISAKLGKLCITPHEMC